MDILKLISNIITITSAYITKLANIAFLFYLLFFNIKIKNNCINFDNYGKYW